MLAFTRGYSIFHLPNVPIFHLYTDPVNAPRKLHWNEEGGYAQTNQME